MTTVVIIQVNMQLPITMTNTEYINTIQVQRSLNLLFGKYTLCELLLNLLLTLIEKNDSNVAKEFINGSHHSIDHGLE